MVEQLLDFHSDLYINQEQQKYYSSKQAEMRVALDTLDKQKNTFYRSLPDKKIKNIIETYKRQGKFEQAKITQDSFILNSNQKRKEEKDPAVFKHKIYPIDVSKRLETLVEKARQNKSFQNQEKFIQDQKTNDMKFKNLKFFYQKKTMDQKINVKFYKLNDARDQMIEKLKKLHEQKV